jgi:NADPH:quinone reductase-like Zn-dependent oxidoreductase
MRSQTPTATSDADHAAPPTMRSIVQDRYGDSGVLAVRDIAPPKIGDDEVLVAVRAAGLDRGTWHLMTGRPYLMRILGFGLRRPRTKVPGIDVSGIVAATGAGVTRFSVGDEVYGMSRGSFGEYAAVREDKLAVKPAGLSFEAAATVPISGGTALQALRDAGRVQAGQRVLVLGASGGVGSYAVQLAKALGAEVTGTSSTAKVDLVRALGADHVIDYTLTDFADGSRTYDLIIDGGGNPRLSRLRRALSPHGTAVIVGGENGGHWTGGFGRSLRAPLVSLFLKQRLTMLASKERATDLEQLSAFIEAGQLTPSIDRTYPLVQVREAMDRLVAGEVRGKIAIVVSEG